MHVVANCSRYHRSHYIRAVLAAVVAVAVVIIVMFFLALRFHVYGSGNIMVIAAFMRMLPTDCTSC